MFFYSYTPLITGFNLTHSVTGHGQLGLHGQAFGPKVCSDTTVATFFCHQYGKKHKTYENILKTYWIYVFLSLPLKMGH